MGEQATSRPDTRTWVTGSEFERIYGPVRPWTPAQARDVLDGIDVPWWVAGGWAIEAFTGVARPHEDIDLSVFRRDLPALRTFLEPRFHLWAASDEGLLHLAPGRAMPEHAGQVWVREHALAPWSCEFVVNQDLDGRWQSKRDPSFSAPLEDVTWERDGVRYLAPELALSHKVATGRPKDDDDLAAALPLLSPRQRDFLADFVRTHAPEHPWRARLDAAT
ncbi:nucleotidyltransferase domain-containing protein [Terrabacter sp. 2RAF25]|uniref:nucleotidyltransferase domain-containing protein n=1 Tax=Terrabacter sp. 2RAF25 TaxID=3232998 RepID=UPI003F95EB36